MINTDNFSSHVATWQQALRNGAIASAFSNNAEAIHQKAYSLEPNMDAFLTDVGGCEAVANEQAIEWLDYMSDKRLHNAEHAIASYLASCKRQFRWIANRIQREAKAIGIEFGKRRTSDIALEDKGQADYEAWTAELSACEGVTKANKLSVVQAMLNTLTEAQRRVMLDANTIANNRKLASEGKPTEGRTKVLSAVEHKHFQHGMARLELVKREALATPYFTNGIDANDMSEAQILIAYAKAHSKTGQSVEQVELDFKITREEEREQILARTKKRASIKKKAIATFIRKHEAREAHRQSWLRRNAVTESEGTFKVWRRSLSLKFHNAKYEN